MFAFDSVGAAPPVRKTRSLRETQTEMFRGLGLQVKNTFVEPTTGQPSRRTRSLPDSYPRSGVGLEGVDDRRSLVLLRAKLVDVHVDVGLASCNAAFAASDATASLVSDSSGTHPPVETVELPRLLRSMHSGPKQLKQSDSYQNASDTKPLESCTSSPRFSVHESAPSVALHEVHSARHGLPSPSETTQKRNRRGVRGGRRKNNQQVAITANDSCQIIASVGDTSNEVHSGSMSPVCMHTCQADLHEDASTASGESPMTNVSVDDTIDVTEAPSASIDRNVASCSSSRILVGSNVVDVDVNEDARARQLTTFLVAGVSRRYTQKLLLADLTSAGFGPGRFDVLYLPYDIAKSRYLDYMIINFVDTQIALTFIDRYGKCAKPFGRYGCKVYIRSAARQGRIATVGGLGKSCRKIVNPHYLPLIFDGTNLVALYE